MFYVCFDYHKLAFINHLYAFYSSLTYHFDTSPPPVGHLEPPNRLPSLDIAYRLFTYGMTFYPLRKASL